jgi:hypothetical protein
MLTKPAPFSPMLLLAVALAGAGLGESARAVTPESPEVKAVIDKGLKFLEGAKDERLGAQCLIGLSFLKNDRDRNHPQIVRALQSCQAFAANPTPTTGIGTDIDNYSIGLAIIFLCEHDPVKNRSAAQKVVNYLLSRQMQNGAWSYPGNSAGDTSQTQYAALGLWMADASGLDVPQSAVERLCGWLLRTQEPGGGWGYHANDPGTMTRVNQDQVRPSLVAAGLGSVYICADLLGITDPKEEVSENKVPPVLREVQQKQGKKKRDGQSKVIDAAAVRRSMADGNQWFAKNFTVRTAEWNYYYLYGLERYMSFRELAEGEGDREPEWYNQVFNFLRSDQLPSGAWKGEGDVEAVNSSFAVLCLARSTRKSINVKLKALGEGVLLGGMGLPKNVSDLQERNGKVVESPLGGSVEEILAIIEDPNNPELKRLVESGQSIPLEADVTKRSGQVTRLRSLVSAGSYEARLLAVKALGKVRDLDNVPVLLFALTDPDVRIVREADLALRFISRKFRGVGLPDDPEPPGSDAKLPAGQWPQVKAAQKAWKQWYLAIRPDAQLLD